MAQRAQRFSNGGGMVREIVDHLHSSCFPTHFLAPGNSGEALERSSNIVEGHAVKPRRGDGHRGVAHVELTNKRYLKLVFAEGEARLGGRTLHLANLLSAIGRKANLQDLGEEWLHLLSHFHA